MKDYMVITMDNGSKERRYYKTLNGAKRFFNRCGSACLYKYNPRTFEFDLIECC